ncbi:MAG TPA: adenylate/guanylate cyclase domain-containing protein [Actinomycetota bacterium]|nr:adenylate/guanylate cyclase domain-containing protein [Actinomycetota bacterium]
MTVAAPAPPKPSDVRTRRAATFLFTDIVGSTEMLTMLGEETWLRALREHNAVVQEAVDRFGGTTLKFLGDGWMITFNCPRDALEAAVAIQRALDRSDAPDAFRLRIGVHMGSAIEEHGDFVGKDVVLASRITREAGPNEIVASADVVDVLDDYEERFDGGRLAHLKGLGPHLVFSVGWTA